MAAGSPTRPPWNSNSDVVVNGPQQLLRLLLLSLATLLLQHHRNCPPFSLSQPRTISANQQHTTQATASALGCAILTTNPRFRTPTYRVMRSVMFALLGLSAFVPVMHGILLNGWEVQNGRMAITYFLGLGLLNGTGTVIYAARVPEKWFPRTFDVYGSSHQIMHVLVACGALSHAIGLVKAFDYWDSMKSSGLTC